MFKKIIISFLLTKGLDVIIDLVVEYIKKDGVTEFEKNLLNFIERLSDKTEKILSDDNTSHS